MSVTRPFNFKKWIDENRDLLKPPVNNKVVYKDTEFIVMVVGGPNSRKDYHFNESEEFFYQLEGDIKVKLQIDGKSEEFDIREGDIFLLPPKIPHNPVRFANTIGLVMERRRREGEMDGLMWFCENCNSKLYEEKFVLNDIASQFQGIFSKFYNSKELRTCGSCGHIMEPPPIIS
ncbi:MAG: 3-hydroxyanthranilate 3,4-dioxygenase [Bacteroidetes bacterium]|jgi:3-hydroxyanthranilate 3,4-dioxygenase|nr:3-hydroxyanthranilate 3,4-dioxygenase [Bacteroidota bacterium]MDF2450601.1 3-hydroxyanthranilate 3,4-dioxygenase [Bacteroidota bacterium]